MNGVDNEEDLEEYEGSRSPSIDVRKLGRFLPTTLLVFSSINGPANITLQLLGPLIYLTSSAPADGGFLSRFPYASMPRQCHCVLASARLKI